MKKIYLVLIVILLLLPSVWALFRPGYFSMHDDLQVMRIYEMERCLADGQIPCRWAPDMAFGYGQAMFNYYSALPYYLGALLRIIFPLSIIGTVKVLFGVSLIFSGIGMYLLAREFWGRIGGLLAMVFYVYAPYHALDVYVRGALSEAFALSIMPFLWFCFYRLVKNGGFRWILGAAFSLGALLTTHNISTMLYAPFTLVWVLYWMVSLRKVGRWLEVGLASVIGLGLGSFFFLPAMLEKNLFQDSFFTTDYFEYHAHFVSLKQLFFERDWGFGPSTFGPNDELSFQIGWPHWWVGIWVGLLAWRRALKRKMDGWIVLAFMFLAFSGLSAYLTHTRSTPIWKLVGVLSFVQFPWRFLGLVIFFLSLAGGALVKMRFGTGKVLAAFVLMMTIVLNVNYFKPEHHFEQETDETKLSGILFEIQQMAAPLDYLPKTSLEAPKELAPDKPQFVSGNGVASNFNYRTNSFFFDVEVYDKARLQIPVIYFPGWKVIIDKKVYPSEPAGKLGLITISLPEGKYMVQGRFENTTVREVANAITVMTLVFVLAGVVWYRRK